jgi:hypothetical protein
MKYIYPWETTGDIIEGKIFEWIVRKDKDKKTVASIHVYGDLWIWEAYVTSDTHLTGSEPAKENAIIVCDSKLIEFGWTLLDKKLMMML